MAARPEGLSRSVWRLLRTPVGPGYRGYLAFGWLILVLFLVQIVTGTLLSLYYQPSPDLAPESVRYVMRDVSWGWLIRGLHHWASFGMIALGLLVFLRVFLQGSYRGVRAANWYIGLCLMLLVICFASSGELLTWDDDAYWTVTRVLQKVASVPGIGPTAAEALRGEPEVAASTLSRIFSVHVLLLPWLTFFLVILNIWLLVQHRSKAPGQQG